MDKNVLMDRGASAHLSSSGKALTDYKKIKDLKDPKWSLIKAICPDVLIATKETYKKNQLKELKKYCGKVHVLEPMATTSTSAKIRRLQIGTAKKLGQALTPKILKTIQDVLD